MKMMYLFQDVGLSCQVDHISAINIILFEKHCANTNKENLFMIVIRHECFEMESDGNQIIEMRIS